KAGDPKPPTRYLGRLLITAKVGIDRDFEEGALALRVTDERQPLAPVLAAARAAPVSRAPRKSTQTGCLKGQIRWIPEKTANPERTSREEHGKESIVASDIATRSTFDASVHALFLEAKWPTDVDFPPVAGLWRPDVLYLEPRSHLSNLDDRIRDRA